LGQGDPRCQYQGRVSCGGLLWVILDGPARRAALHPVDRVLSAAIRRSADIVIRELPAGRADGGRPRVQLRSRHSPYVPSCLRRLAHLGMLFRPTAKGGTLCRAPGVTTRT
jgi:hypothetical protein